MNKNEKSSKLRVFFFQVPLPEDRYRCQAPRTDVLETLRLRGAQKMAKNGQKLSKMAKNDLMRLLHGKTPQIPKSSGISD